MIKLIINGDDFGYSRGVNWGIIDAYTSGMLTSATVMTNMPGAEHAYELARAHPGLGVGVHLNLTLGRPVLSGHQTLLQQNGTLQPRSYYKNGGKADAEEVYKEWKAQIERAIEGGIRPTHLDSHHHMHSLNGVTEIFVLLAKEYQLPTRVLFPETDAAACHSVDIVMTDRFLIDIQDLYQSPEDIATSLGAATSVEVMTHPAYLDKLIMDQSSLLYPRLEDFAALTDKHLKKRLEQSGLFEFATFRELT